MSKELTIYFIYADECQDCEDMRNTLADAISKSSYDRNNCEIIEINSEKDEAVELALDNDIDDLPACIIGNYSFCGRSGYTLDSVLEAIEKTWEDDTGAKDDETHRNIY